MKLRYFIYGLILQYNLQAQPALQILKRANAACGGVKSGYYETNLCLLPFSGVDTLRQTSRIFFKPTAEKLAFPNLCLVKEGNENRCMLTGNDFYIFKGDTAIQFNKRLCPEDFAYNAQNYGGFKPYVNGYLSPFQSKKINLKPRQKLTQLADTTVMGQGCYHLQLTEMPEQDSTVEEQIYQIEWRYLIRKSDFLPIGFSQNYFLKGARNITNQYESMTVGNFDPKPAQLDQVLNPQVILKDKTIKPYLPRKKENLLPIGSPAPEWNLPMTIHENINLSDMKGELVLMDFYFISCIPCRKAIPVLNKLQDKYGKQGLSVIGINPIDTNIVALEQFFEDKEFKYPSVLYAEKTATDYHVNAYPTLYLIDRKGRIIFAQSGFGEELETQLEELIKKHL